MKTYRNRPGINYSTFYRIYKREDGGELSYWSGSPIRWEALQVLKELRAAGIPCELHEERGLF